MKIMIFTEGTILMHRNAIGCTREELIRQVKKDESVHDYSSYVPIRDAVEKIKRWKEQDVGLLYLTSRREKEEIEAIQNVLKKYGFPEGELVFRLEGEEYKDVAERIIPDILIEDDCESIGMGGMVITNISPEIKGRINSIIVKEFAGIDHLPNEVDGLMGF